MILLKFSLNEYIECVICSSNGNSQLQKDFVPCVLNCSHHVLFKDLLLTTAIIQFKSPKSNGLADPVENSDKCPLCGLR